jgi:hypothetical protein
MGYAIAEAHVSVGQKSFWCRTDQSDAAAGVQSHSVQTACQMHAAVMRAFELADVSLSSRGV